VFKTSIIYAVLNIIVGIMNRNY